MARGCPVVVTDAVQSCEHVRAAGAGEVVPCDVAALAAALDQVLAEPRRRHACGEAGREYARQHFRWEKIANEVRHMYEDCLLPNSKQQIRQPLEQHRRGNVGS
jgi:glycosyltransferase involved in cell wall biosynthesis